MEPIPEFPSYIEEAAQLVATENREVYRAFDRLAGSEIVVKCLRPPFEEVEAQSLRNEYLRLEALDHPYWVRPDRFFTLKDGSLGFTLEYSPGKTFEEFPVRDWTPDTLEVARQVLSGLHALHVNGFAQLDLKPDQLLIEWRGKSASSWDDDQAPFEEHAAPVHVHMFDLGLSSPLGAEIPPAGTAGYMAPELLRGAKEWDARVDLYAFGALLHELILEEKVFHGSHGGEIMRAQLAGPNFDALYRSGRIPRPLVRLLDELLSPDPEYRPVSATEVWTRLREVATGQTTRRLPTNLTGARRLPFMGRETEVEAFQSWLARETPGDRTCVIRGERGLGASRLQHRFAAIAQTRGWIPKKDTWEKDGRSLRIQVEVLEPTLSQGIHTQLSTEDAELRIELGEFPIEDMRRLAASRGLAAPSLIDEVARICIGRPVLLSSLISELPTPLDSAAQNGRVDVGKAIDQLEVPEAWKDWVGRSLESLDGPTRLDIGVSSIGTLLEHSIGEGIWSWNTLWANTMLQAKVVDLQHLVTELRQGKFNPVQRARAAIFLGCESNPDLGSALEILYSKGDDYEAYLLSLAALSADQGREIPDAHLLAFARTVLSGNFSVSELGPESARLVDAKLDCSPVFAVLASSAEDLHELVDPFRQSELPKGHVLSTLWLRAGIQLEEARHLTSGETAKSYLAAGGSEDVAKLENIHIGRGQGVEDSLDALSSCARTSTEGIERATVGLLQGSFLFHLGRLELAEAAYRDALKADAESCGRSRELLLLLNLGGVLFESGNLWKLHEVVAATTERAQSEMRWELLLLVVSNRATVAAMMGNLGEALRCVNWAQSLALELGAPHERYARNISAVMRWLGRNSYFTDSTPEQRSGQDELDAAVFSVGLGIASIREGAPHAHKHLETGVSRLEEAGAHSDAVEGLASWALCELDTGNYEAAGRVLERLGAMREYASSVTLLEVELAELEAGTVLSMGADPGQLVEEWRQLSERFDSTGVRRNYWRTHWGVSRVYASIGEFRLSETWSESARELLLSVAGSIVDARDTRTFLRLPACQSFLSSGANASR